MSNAVAESHQSASSPKKRTLSPLVWVLILLVAGAAFAGAVTMAGGIGGALELLGLGSGPTDDAPAVTPAKGAPSAAASATTDAGVAGELPDSALKAMYLEQLQSQDNIGLLVGGSVAKLTYGTPEESSKSAKVPVRVEFKDGTSVSGEMVLKRFGEQWYFFRITAVDHSVSKSAAYPDDIDKAVVSTIAEQQATAANQDMIKNGILGGGYKEATVTGVEKGSGTATIGLKLTGGTEPDSVGEILCIEKSDGPNSYWFITEFSAK